MKFISIEETKPGEASKIRLILLGTLAFGILTVLLYPLDILAHYFPGLFREDSSCILLNATGLPCPFCGMSRGFTELTKLNFAGCFYYNPSSVIFFTFIGILGFTILLLSFFNKKISINFNKKTLVIFVVVLLTMWVLNIFFGHHER